MTTMLCTECAHVGSARDGACDKCGGRLLLPADSPNARRFIEQRAARQGDAPPLPDAEPSLRAQATGKVLGRGVGKLGKLGKLFGK